MNPITRRVRSRLEGSLARVIERQRRREAANKATGAAYQSLTAKGERLRRRLQGLHREA